MLDVRLPYKALDERMGRNEIKFAALAVYFFHNKNNDWKPHYIVHVAREWENRNWDFSPINKKKLLYGPEFIKAYKDNYYDAYYNLYGKNARLVFSQYEPVKGLAYEAEQKDLINHQNFEYHSHYENFNPNEQETIYLPFKLFNFIEKWNGKRYEMDLEKNVK